MTFLLMISYLLDSDIAIYAMSGRHPSLAKRIEQHADEVALSAIAYAELAFGVEKSRRRQANTRALQAFIRYLPIIPFDADASGHYAEIRAELERLGTPCGANDMLIGAHARSLGMTLVTNNRREFDRMPGLIVENWVA